MFATATRNFVDEVDPGGLLIPMRSVNDSIALLTVVVSQKPFWFWQKPKHLPTDFTLNDLLVGDTPITPVLTEIDFIKYNGTYGGHIQGSVDATFIQSNVNVEGKESSKLQMSFGSLKKDEVDVRRLLQDSKNRVLDMSHCLIQQTKKKCQVFGVVKERIVTNQPCSVVEELQQAGSCAGTFSLWGLKSPKVLLKDNASLGKDSNVAMEIPTNTTLAYALIDLVVKHDGRYGELAFDFSHSIPKVKLIYSIDSYDTEGKLKNLGAHFQLLAALPASSRSSLLEKITALMVDKAALNSWTFWFVQRIPTALKCVISFIYSEWVFNFRCHLLQVEHLMESGESPASGADVAALPENVLPVMEHLFNSSGMSLQRDGDTARSQINQLKQPGNQPLIMCIALRGLRSLNPH
uniref:Gasdermin Eb n=1 Tax=Hippocampus comes TaxID=109280 RepID=A0A3Q2Z198_HIPCM